MTESREVNVSDFRKDLKRHLGDTCYGHKEFDVQNHNQNVAWVTSPDTKKMLKPFEKLYDLVKDKEAFIEDISKALEDDGDGADAHKVLSVMKKHLSSSTNVKERRRAVN